MQSTVPYLLCIIYSNLAKNIMHPAYNLNASLSYLYISIFSFFCFSVNIALRLGLILFAASSRERDK